MHIRLATQKDVPSLSILYTEFFSYNAEKQPEYYANAKESGEYPASVIESDTGDILIAEVDGLLAGFVHVEEDATPPFPSVQSYKFACIVDFMVTQPYRKSGIGHLLLEEVKRWAKLRHLAYIELMVLENNEIGISFYEREHFVTLSRTLRLDLA